MNTEEVAKKVVELVRKQAWYEALDLYDDNIVSVEAFSMSGGSPETRVWVCMESAAHRRAHRPGRAAS